MTIRESTTTSMKQPATELSKTRDMKVWTLSISTVAAMTKIRVYSSPKMIIQAFLREPHIGTESAVMP